MNKEQRIKEIIYQLACDFKFDHYSTIDEIDYKFWEDVQPQDMVKDLAEQIVNKEETIELLIDSLEEMIYHLPAEIDDRVRATRNTAKDLINKVKI
jgi:hypothetical protein